MSLRYRLAFYLFGLLIGFYFVGEFLSAKAESRGVTFCYFPNCRVIKDIRSKPFKTSAAVDSIFAKKLTNMKEIDVAISNGDVDFEKVMSRIKMERNTLLNLNCLKIKKLP